MKILAGCYVFGSGDHWGAVCIGWGCDWAVEDKHKLAADRWARYHHGQHISRSIRESESLHRERGDDGGTDA